MTLKPLKSVNKGVKEYVYLFENKGEKELKQKMRNLILKRVVNEEPRKKVCIK